MLHVKFGHSVLLHFDSADTDTIVKQLCRGAGWGGALRRPESKVIEESFELALSGDTTTNGQRKGVPNTCSSNSEAAGTETCADTGNEQQFRVRRTQGTRWSVMFQG